MLNLIFVGTFLQYYQNLINSFFSIPIFYLFLQERHVSEEDQSEENQINEEYHTVSIKRFFCCFLLFTFIESFTNLKSIISSFPDAISNISQTQFKELNIRQNFIIRF